MRKTVSPLYLPIALLTLLWIAIPSCLHDHFPEEEPGIITVSLDGVSTRATGDLVTDDDATINKVRIFVFVGEFPEKNILFTSGNDNFTNPFILEVATGSKDVYVVANESATLTTTLEGILSKAELMAVMADQISAPLGLPLLMTGKISGAQVAVMPDPDRNTANVTLTRAAAKISLSFLKDTDANVSITKVSLIHNTTLTPIWEGKSIVGTQSYWLYEYTTNISLTSSAQLIGSFYFYENLTGGNKENATRLEVEALYNNVPTKYRVYINENVSTTGDAGDPSSSATDPADHLYAIKRNHAYQLTGTIKNIGEFEGLTLMSQILPWKKLPSNWLFDWTSEITPQPTPDNHTYTVSAAGEQQFTFKLTNPIDAKWIANLTNPTYFEFVGAYNGVTDQEVTITIKAKESAGAEERTTEFYINAQYAVGWEEIPLLQGSSLAGEGNRIIIRQPAATNP